MTLKVFFICAAVLVPVFSKAQFERPDVWFSVGYQYANFGNSLSPANNRMYQFNRSNGDGKDFSNPGNAYGAVIRLMIKGENNFVTELAVSNKKVLNSGSYNDSVNNTEVGVRTKSRVRSFNIGAHYLYKRFTFGASADIGTFKSTIKYRNASGENSDKWNPWFYAPKVFGSGYTGKSPVIGATVSVGYALSKFADMRIYRQFTLFGMGGDLSDRYFSLSNWGVELAVTFGK